MKKIYATTGFLAALLLSSFTTFAQTQSRDELIKEIETRRKELLALEQSFLSPTEQDRARYSSHTGGIKGSLMIRGGGAYYSFIRKTHEYGYGTDIGLYLGDLATGFAGANYGLLVLLGDVPLESVGLELPEVNILANYTPATQLPHARVEQRRFGEGTEIEVLKLRTVCRCEPMRLTWCARSTTIPRT